MALIEEELDILSVKELFHKDLHLPEYQRPYRWSAESVNTLYDDIRAAMRENGEYRLGSVVLYKNRETNAYEIVDGQQRITTLTLLLRPLIGEDDDVLEHTLQMRYSRSSSEALKRNHAQVKSRINELGAERKAFAHYVKERCTFVSIVTDDQAEAFQFFDSQNHRGKELMPHDLLKAFHLREMGGEEEQVKLSVVNRWESYKEEDLGNLFSFHLYPLTQWYKGRSGIHYSQADIRQFKGAKKDLAYDYILYHKAANLFVEDMNRYSREFNRKEVNQFQLTQPILSGVRFFRYVTHYMELLDKINAVIETYTPQSSGIIPVNGNGNKYVKRLLQNALMFYADRFGVEAIDETAYRKIFSFCYVIRLTMYAVHQKTINRYALGTHENNAEGVNLFERIYEMAVPGEISGILVPRPASDRLPERNIAKFEKLYQTVSEYCGWEG